MHDHFVGANRGSRGDLTEGDGVMALFRDPCGEFRLRIDIYKQLLEGCKRHPAYRAKRKPSVTCKQCELLWDLTEQLADFDEQMKRHQRASLEASRKEAREESERLERYASSHQ